MGPIAIHFMIRMTKSKIMLDEANSCVMSMISKSVGIIMIVTRDLQLKS